LTINPLFGKIKLAKSSFSVLRSGLEFKLKKEKAVKWPSLYGTVTDTSSTQTMVDTVNDGEENVQKGASVAKNPPAAAPIPSVSPPASAPSTKAPSYPTSSKSGPKDWEKIANEKDDGEGSDDAEGGDGVDKFFKKLYADADADTRRAMLKSFTESDGTALSTNWEEVKKGKVVPKPPSDD
jgi:suppressor of G2 allele of SKP1